jgi:hypothetical protein
VFEITSASVPSHTESSTCVYVVPSDSLMNILYPKIGEPLLFGSVQSIRTSRPLIDVTGAAGSSGVYAAKMTVGEEKSLKP